MAKKEKDVNANATPASVADGPEIVSKLSAATVVGDVSKVVKGVENFEEAGTVPLFTVIGIANGYKTGKSTFGEWLAFSGSFEITRSSDGKQFAGGKVFLPNSIQDILLAHMKADKDTGEIPEVQFALEIGVKHAKNAFGYTYTVTPIVKPSGADPLAALREQMQARLAAPK